MTTFKPPPFDISVIIPGSVVLVVGKRGCGKSTLLAALATQVSTFARTGMLVTSRDIYTNDIVLSCLPPESIPNVLSPELLDQFCTSLGSRLGVVVCDDVSFDQTFMQSTALANCVDHCANDQQPLTLLFGVQHWETGNSQLKAAADFVFAFRDNNVANQNECLNYFVDSMPQSVFTEIFAACTANYGCLVIDVKKANSGCNWQECVFKFQAPYPMLG